MIEKWTHDFGVHQDGNYSISYHLIIPIQQQMLLPMRGFLRLSPIFYPVNFVELP